MEPQPTPHKSNSSADTCDAIASHWRRHHSWSDCLLASIRPPIASWYNYLVRILLLTWAGFFTALHFIGFFPHFPPLSLPFVLAIQIHSIVWDSLIAYSRPLPPSCLLSCPSVSHHQGKWNHQQQMRTNNNNENNNNHKKYNRSTPSDSFCWAGPVVWVANEFHSPFSPQLPPPPPPL